MLRFWFRYGVENSGVLQVVTRASGSYLGACVLKFFKKLFEVNVTRKSWVDMG